MEVNAEKVLSNPEEEISKLCEIDLDDLTNCLKEHSVLYGRAYVYCEKAKAQASAEKWRYEQAKTQAFSKLREDGMAIGSAKEQCELESDVVALYEKLLKAEKKTGIFYALLRGLEHRKDMLIQLSSREKKEYGAF